ARHAGDVAVEQRDRPTVGLELACDQVEERRLPRAVGPDDQAPLARLDLERHVGGDAEAAERLAEMVHAERAHRPPSPPRAGTAAAPRGRPAARAQRQTRTVPGTSPSGMNTTIRPKIAPSTKSQRAR